MNQIPLRSPEQVMRLTRLGSMHQSRLSFSRSLLRRLVNDRWKFSKPVQQFDDRGIGRAVYVATDGKETYSLAAFTSDIPDEMRTDRVIANMWDATFALVKGIPTSEDLDRLSHEVPLQEKGRISAMEVSLSRANKSVRIWKHVLECLSSGKQPDFDEVAKIGYLMRTTAVYGAGKFGAADRLNYGRENLLGQPFFTEILSVYLIRWFAVDLIEYLAVCQGGKQAVTMNPKLKKCLGIGNSTGLGMAPFLINHPVLLNNWITAKETALSRVLSVEKINTQQRKTFDLVLQRATQNVNCWHTEHEFQKKKLVELSDDLDRLKMFFQNIPTDRNRPWQTIFEWAEVNLHKEGQEMLVTLLLELYPQLVDDLVNRMYADEENSFFIPTGVSIGEFRERLASAFGWSDRYDFNDKKETHFFWYVSEEKLEPRLGRRYEEPGAELELPLGIAKMAADVYKTVLNVPDDTPLAEFLLTYPEHRYIARRVFINADFPYSEVRDNLIGSEMLPLDLLRCKLSFLGADRFDPRSTKWIRICLFRNAPYPEDLVKERYDDLWVYPND